MQFDPALIVEALKALPGFVGSAISLLWARKGDSKRRVFGRLLAGAITAYLIGEWVAQLFGLPVGVARFFTGMLSMAVADKAFGMWNDFDLGPMLTEALRVHVLRLPPRPEYQPTVATDNTPLE